MGTWKVNTTQYKFIFSLYKGEIVKILIFYKMPAPVFFFSETKLNSIIAKTLVD